MINLHVKDRKLLAALPILLIGLGITGGCLIAGGACYDIPTWRLYAGIAFGGIISIIIGVVAIIGLINRMPDWSVIWIAISMIGFLVVINLVSSFGLPQVAELIVLIPSILLGFYVFYLVTKEDWQSAGLFGIGLSTALSLILFFMASNISHDEIKIGYYDLTIAIVMRGLIYWYMQCASQTKLFVLITEVTQDKVLINS